MIGGALNSAHNMWLRLRRGYPRTTVIDRTASVSQTTFEGLNRIGRKCEIRRSMIGYGTYIGANSVLESVSVGRYCSIGSDVCTPTGQHPTKGFVSTAPCFFSLGGQNGASYIKEQKFEEIRYASRPFTRLIGNDVWICANAIILEGVTIGDGCVIGAGAVVTRDTPPYSISVGVPAKIIGYRFSSETIERLERVRWWDRGEEWIKANAELFDDVNTFLEVADS